MYNFGASPSALPLLFLLPSSPLLSQLDFFTRASWRTPFGLPERVRGTFSGFLARPLSPSLLFFFFFPFFFKARYLEITGDELIRRVMD